MNRDFRFVEDQLVLAGVLVAVSRAPDWAGFLVDSAMDGSRWVKRVIRKAVGMRGPRSRAGGASVVD